ncbi:MAG: S1 RNA-binding domain-containing protein [Acholeplasmataceae bacterium]
MDLKNKDKSQFDEMSMDDLKDLKVNVPRVGQRVTAKVVEIVDDKLLLLDLHAQTEGRIYLEQYTKKPVDSFQELGVEVGDMVTAEIKKVQDEPALILLSRLSMVSEEHLLELEDALKNETVITAKVKASNKGGLVLNYHSYELFLPKSLLDHELYEIRDQLINTELEVVISEIKPARGRSRRPNIIASRKPIFEAARQAAYEERMELRLEELDKINTGDILVGTIEKLEPHAATVKFEHVMGLLRISQVSHYRIDKLEDVLSIGEEVKVKVIKKEGNRLDLSIKVLLPTPFEEFAATHKVGDTVKGKVYQKLPFGLRIEVARDVVGLLHRSEYSWNPNDNFDAYVTHGDEVELAIIQIDKKRERINLSKKALEDNPWRNVTIKRHDITEAKILEFKEDHLIVEVQGVEGTIRNDEMGLEKGRPEEYFAVGDVVEAVATKVDRRQWLLELSVKQVKLIAAEQEVQKHLDEQDDDGGMTIGEILNQD